MKVRRKGGPKAPRIKSGQKPTRATARKKDEGFLSIYIPDSKVKELEDTLEKADEKLAVEAAMREERINNIRRTLRALHAAAGASDTHGALLTERDMQALGLNAPAHNTFLKAAQYNQFKYEVIEIADDYELDSYRFQVLKYILRAPFKREFLSDLKKAAYYLTRLIRLTENGEGPFTPEGLYHGSKRRG